MPHHKGSKQRRLFALLLIVTGALIWQSERQGHASRAVAPLSTLQGETAIAQLKQAGLYDSLSAAMTASRYGAQPLPEGAGEFAAVNPAQGLRTEFRRDGLKLESGAGEQRRQMRLRLRSVGYGKRQVAVGQSMLKAQGQRIEYTHTLDDSHGQTTIAEWYVNQPEGLEQGFTVAAPPCERQAGEPLRLTLALAGEMQARAGNDGQAVEWVDEKGSRQLRYDHLQVSDAKGQPLAARMKVAGKELRLEVEDEGASYPLTIDPTVTQQAYLKASNTGASDNFGISVAVSGDTVVVGAYAESSNATGVNGDQSNNAASFSGAAYVFTRSGGVWSQQAYLKASNTEAFDQFGASVAISGDTIVVGAENESSNATGVNGNQSDNSVSGAGAAYVFTRSGGVWSQQAYLKASNTGMFDSFGRSVAISGDTIVVATTSEDSSATGVNGNQADDSATDSGAAYIFTRSGGVWSQQAYLKASNTEAFDQFGLSVAIAGDTIVVGAPGESSNATGVNGNQSDNSAESSGAAYVFTRSGGVWSQQAYLKASNTEESDLFGSSVAISGDTVVVGAPGESSNATGINGDQSNNAASFSGAAYVFTRSSGVWSQQAYLKASNTEAGDQFGTSVAIAGDTTVVGAVGESSNATGINGDQSNNSANASGAAYVFARSGGVWSQQAYLKASNTGAADLLGNSIAMSGNIAGNTFVVGAYGEDSNAMGVNGDGSNNSASASGAAYVFFLPFPNTAPTISTAAFNPLSRERGAAAVNSSIATVNDTESGAAAVTVTVNGGTSATVNGVTISNLVNTGGTITADVVADCSATNATFTLTASDGTLTSDAMITVNVTADTQKPAISCPSNMTVNADPGSCSKSVIYTVPVGSDNCGTPVVMCVPASGSAFQKGTTTVTCTATDGAGNQTSCTFTVTVNDTQAPTIMCPANLTRITARPGDATVAVNFTTPTAADNCGSAAVACTPPSGAAFPVGTTSVTCTATDAASNQASCTFTVTVFDVCLQDDSNPNTSVVFNTRTGDYLFCAGGVKYTGRGTVTGRGLTYTLQQTAGDRRVTATVDGGSYRGNGSYQKMGAGAATYMLTDRDTRNNSCPCQTQ